MTDWAYSYRRGQIPAKAVIHEHRPGAMLADAVTEIQDRAITNVEVVAGDGLNGSVTVADGSATINISLDETSPSGSGGGDGLPEGGEQYQVLQRDSNGDAVWDWVRAH